MEKDRIKRYGANLVERRIVRKGETERLKAECAALALKALENAYAPYSSFRVGAAVVSAATGRIYTGCNMENASYGATICAERNAITTAVASEGAIGLDMVVVASECSPPAEPCAVCLQVMSEFIRPSTPVVLVNTKGERAEYRYRDFLPRPFTFKE